VQGYEGVCCVVGEEDSLMRNRDVKGRDIISMENLPKYLAYDNVFDGI
jgi:hypothetical protein